MNYSHKLVSVAFVISIFTAIIEDMAFYASEETLYMLSCSQMLAGHIHTYVNMSTVLVSVTNVKKLPACSHNIISS